MTFSFRCRQKSEAMFWEKKSKIVGAGNILVLISIGMAFLGPTT